MTVITGNQTWRRWPAAPKAALLQRLKALPSGFLARRAAAERSLGEFVSQAWHVVEPATQFVPGWHIDAISEHLEAITSGEIRNLIVNIPPRHMKSLLVGVFWPAWTWATRAHIQFLCASYAQALAIRDAVKSRRLIQSPWYQERWGHTFALTGDQNQKMRYENDQAGHRIAAGVGGTATGDGGDILVADDLLKAGDADSDAMRTAANDFWFETMSTRGNDPKTVAKVIIMQRLHERDLTGAVLDRMREGGEHYEHLCLPAEHDKRQYASGIDFEDPRTGEGELLWESQFGADELSTLKASLGKRAAAGQLQQLPAPAGGMIFLSEWWADGLNRYDAEDKRIQNTVVGRWLSFDTALKDKESNDYTAMGVYELTPDYQLMKRNAWWRRMQFPQLATTIEDEAQRWNFDEKLRGIVVEDKGSGTSALQSVRQSAPDWLAALLIAFNPQGSKEGRGRQASLWCERGCVLLPSPSPSVPWLLSFCDDFLFKFPGGAFDDPVDELTQIVIYLEHYLAEGWRGRMQ